MGIGRRPSGSGPRGSRGRRPTSGSLVGPLLWAGGVLAIAALLVSMDRGWQDRQQAESPDPAVRVAGAVRSISGGGSVRRVAFDASTGSAQVDVTSRYYDARKSPQDNREHLSTEGRLVAQLVLSGEPAVRQLTIRLYAGRTLLTTVSARQGQEYEQFGVEYAGPLTPR